MIMHTLTVTVETQDGTLCAATTSKPGSAAEALARQVMILQKAQVPYETVPGGIRYRSYGMTRTLTWDNT